ncbi:MAG: AMP-binding protein [Bacteroidales bacterium]|nr:AMP-binding protein [Bacteroidales bacterium]
MGISRKLLIKRDNYVTTLGKLFEYSTLVYSKRQMAKFVDGEQAYTYESFRHKCNELSHLLSRFGISAGDKVAILSQNMPNWTVAFFTATAFGRIPVPILPESSENEVTNILSHSETKVIFVSKRHLKKITPEMMDKLTLVFDIETFEMIKKDDNAYTCDGWTKEPIPDDLAALIYTSGTTGSAKGVMLSHRNLAVNCIEAFHAQKCNKKDTWLSILPMSHTYEMAISMLYPFFVGACVNYIQKPPTPTVLMSVLKQLRPTIMLVVPLIIEKIYKASVAPTISKSVILSWMQEHMPWLLYRIVGAKLKATFGGRLRFFGIGGSKLDPAVESFLQKAKFPYAIGYGSTECAPLISAACVGKTAVGSIGLPCHGVEMKLADVNPETGEGEICVRGDNVMLGYYKDPERTRKAIDDEGWYHTNDLACMDAKGRYYIKGRLNNMILGASGENIYPEEIENVINNFSGVNESLVMERDGKLVALVKFDDNFLNWDQASEDKFLENVKAKKDALLEYVNKHVSKSSKVNGVEVMKDPFEKTATQKIRRFKYKDAVGDDVQQERQQQESENK